MKRKMAIAAMLAAVLSGIGNSTKKEVALICATRREVPMHQHCILSGLNGEFTYLSFNGGQRISADCYRGYLTFEGNWEFDNSYVESVRFFMEKNHPEVGYVAELQLTEAGVLDCGMKLVRFENVRDVFIIH